MTLYSGWLPEAESGWKLGKVWSLFRWQEGEGDPCLVIYVSGGLAQVQGGPDHRQDAASIAARG